MSGSKARQAARRYERGLRGECVALLEELMNGVGESKRVASDSRFWKEDTNEKYFVKTDGRLQHSENGYGITRLGRANFALNCRPNGNPKNCINT